MLKSDKNILIRIINFMGLFVILKVSIDSAPTIKPVVLTIILIFMYSIFVLLQWFGNVPPNKPLQPTQKVPAGKFKR